MKRVFLLGGHDLEMLEIKKMLQEAGEVVLDKNLSWGAPLSAYKDAFNDKDTFVGIELEEDISPPKHYVEIDHHGKNAHKSSSIEQVAELLDIKLNRWQKLVAANDARYISGLKQYCASDEEIEQIRLQDRAAQGVTDEDEKLAEKSIDEAGDSFVIYALTPHFSAIADRVYDKFTHYIIYNDNSAVFYGFSIKKLLDFFNKKQISPEKYYYGGGEHGFFGIKKNSLKSEEIKSLVEKFSLINKEIQSYHTFMFPFTFGEGKREFVKGKEWKYISFNVEEARDYNEYMYFYKHVQKALFSDKNEEDSSISRYYEYKKQKGSFIIDTNNLGRYELELDGISLRIFNPNVAILSLNLINREYCKQKDILVINDFGRRIYPQFLGDNFSIKETKDAFLAKEIILRFDDGEELREDFCSLIKKKNLKLEKLSLLPNYISSLIHNNFSNIDKLRPIIDDRMFVISQYHNDNLGKKLKKYNSNNGYAYENDDFWYQYIFIDGNGKNCQSKHMTQKLIQKSTYDRWIEWGTLFGISRYSFVVLTNSSFGRNVILQHTQTIYFQIFTLLLAYRAIIIKFSDEIQNVTNEKKEEDLAKETKNLYRKYLNFLNKLYFKEVTAQDQGIELYNKAMQIMDIPKYMIDLDSEINELHTYVDMVEEKKRNKQLDLISKMGAVFLPPSLIAGIFGMNVVSFDGDFTNEALSLGILFISIVFSIFIFKFQKSKRFFYRSLITSLIVFLLIGGFLYSIDKPEVDTFTKKTELLNTTVKKENHE